MSLHGTHSRRIVPVRIVAGGSPSSSPSFWAIVPGRSSDPRPPEARVAGGLGDRRTGQLRLDVPRPGGPAGDLRTLQGQGRSSSTSGRPGAAPACRRCRRSPAWPRIRGSRTRGSSSSASRSMRAAESVRRFLEGRSWKMSFFRAETLPPVFLDRRHPRDLHHRRRRADRRQAGRLSPVGQPGDRSRSSRSSPPTPRPLREEPRPDDVASGTRD